MEIKLDDKFMITADANQYILQKKRGERFSAISYFTELSGAIQEYLDISVRLSDVSSIEGLLDYQNKLLHSLNQALQPLDFEVELKKTTDKTK